MRTSMIISKIFLSPLKGKTLLFVILTCVMLIPVGGYWLLRGTRKSGEVTDLSFLPANLYNLLDFRKLEFDGEIYYTLWSHAYGQRLNLYGKLTPDTISRLESDPGSLGFEPPKLKEFRLKAKDFPYSKSGDLPESVIKKFQFHPDGKWSYRTSNQDDLRYYMFGKGRTYTITSYVFLQSRLCIISINNNLR